MDREKMIAELDALRFDTSKLDDSVSDDTIAEILRTIQEAVAGGGEPDDDEVDLAELYDEIKSDSSISDEDKAALLKKLEELAGSSTEEEADAHAEKFAELVGAAYKLSEPAPTGRAAALAPLCQQYREAGFHHTLCKQHGCTLEKYAEDQIDIAKRKFMSKSPTDAQAINYILTGEEP